MNHVVVLKEGSCKNLQQVGVYGTFSDVESADKIVVKLNKSKSDLKYKVQIEGEKFLVVLVKPKVEIQYTRPRFVMPLRDDPRWTIMANDIAFIDDHVPITDVFDISISQFSSCTIHYTIWSNDGQLISSTRFNKQPYHISMSNVCPGWRSGILGMHTGGIRFLYIPSAMAGNLGQGKYPGMDVVCEIEVLGITA